MKGKTIINKIIDGCSLLFKQWHVTVNLACIVPRTSIHTHNSETMMEISCVCVSVCVNDWSFCLRCSEKKTVQGAACKRFLERADGEIFSEAVVTSLTICFSINFRCVFIDCFAYSTQFCLQVQPHCTHPAVGQRSGWSREHVTGGCAEAVKIIQNVSQLIVFSIALFLTDKNVHFFERYIFLHHQMAHRHRARHSCFIKNENKNCQLWNNTICPFVPFHESNECGLRKKVPSVWHSASGAELCCFGLVFACQDCLHLENLAPQNFHFKKARLGCGVVCLLRSLKWHMDAVAGLCMARHFVPTGSVHCGEETFWRNRPTEHVPVVFFIFLIYFWIHGTHGVCGSVNSSPRRAARRRKGSADSNGRTGVVLVGSGSNKTWNDHQSGVKGEAHWGVREMEAPPGTSCCEPTLAKQD